MSEPKRYETWETGIIGQAKILVETDAPGGVSLVLASDYDTLKAHAEALAAALVGVYGLAAVHHGDMTQADAALGAYRKEYGDAG